MYFTIIPFLNFEHVRILLGPKTQCVNSGTNNKGGKAYAFPPLS
jgi:hypothetical protein